MIILVQNLQKIPGLVSLLVEQYKPVDVALCQEISLSTEEVKDYHVASFTSKRGYGTAILSRGELSNIQKVPSPHAEFGGFIVKKTTVATVTTTSGSTIQLISFHGYNGQPFKDVSKLIDHVRAVVEVLDKQGPAVFAGDFNTWTPLHVEAVEEELRTVGFQPAYSWPYPGRETPLDHVFLRGLGLKSASHFASESDHQGAILEVQELSVD